MSLLVKEKVEAFYEDDDISRLCPGKKDCLEEMMTLKKRRLKRLVLSNLSEIYSKFKEENPDLKIGFSTFASLRPRWCVLAGPSGTHSVCVCTHH